MTLREYYIVKQIPILEGKKYSKGFSLLKYTDSNKQGSEVGKVYQLKDIIRQYAESHATFETKYKSKNKTDLLKIIKLANMEAIF